MAPRFVLIAAPGLALLALLAWFNYYFTPSLSIWQPVAGDSVCEPIAVSIKWGGELVTLSATVDNSSGAKNVQLTQNAANQRANGLAEGDAGSRKLTVTAELKPRYFGSVYPNQVITETRSFTVKDPTLQFQPAAVSLAQPGTQQASVSRACMSTALPLVVQLATSAEFVAKPSSPTVTIAATQTSMMLAVTAGTRPGVAEIRGSSTHHGKAISSSSPLKATVARATGAFARVDTSFASPSSTLTSPSGAFSAHIGPAVVNPSVPPPFATYEAQFKRGTTNVASAVQFATAAAGGGVGFCSGSTVGVVLSGYAPGAAGYVFYLLDLRGQPAFQEYDVEGETANAATGTPFFYRPTVLLSPDCSLAIIAGAHPASNQEPHFMTVVDLTKRAPVPSCEFAFGGRDDATDLSATVVNRPNGKQAVEVSVGGTAIPMVCLIP